MGERCMNIILGMNVIKTVRTHGDMLWVEGDLSVGYRIIEEIPTEKNKHIIYEHINLNDDDDDINEILHKRKDSVRVLTGNGYSKHKPLSTRTTIPRSL